MQAAGIGGGTEHASAIFYGEKGVTAGRAPVVHEVAHQWWGNAVTEKDWDDVWLSEGFATYFTHSVYRAVRRARRLRARAAGRHQHDRALRRRPRPIKPVIHRNLADMSKVLNRLVYQKGGWVLHMLRGTIGTEHFWDGIREYYRRYRNQNASTDDFRRVMEQASGTPLSWFFDQWLTRPGMPALRGGWRYDAATRAGARRDHADPDRRSVPDSTRDRDRQRGRAARIEKIELTAPTAQFAFPADTEPTSVTLDPNTWVLMQVEDFVKR